jgi:hypothetical protein
VKSLNRENPTKDFLSAPPDEDGILVQGVVVGVIRKY